jgi:hypothetical protein
MGDIRFAPRAESLQGSATLQITAKAAELKAAGRDVVSLSAGQPDFPSPPAAVEAAARPCGRAGPDIRPTPAFPTSPGGGRPVGACTDYRRILPGAGLLRANTASPTCWRPCRRHRFSFPSVVVSYPDVKRLDTVAGEGSTSPRKTREAAEGGGMIFNSPCNPPGFTSPGDRRPGDALGRKHVGHLRRHLRVPVLRRRRSAPPP